MIATNLSSAFYCCKPSAHGIKKRAKSSIFLPCGDEAAHPAKQLTPPPKRGFTALPRRWPKNCAKQHPGKRHRFWSHRHRYEPDARSGRTARSPGRNPCRPLRRTGRGRKDDLTCSQAPSYMTGQIIDLTADFYRNCRHKYIRKGNLFLLLIGTWFPFFIFL